MQFSSGLNNNEDNMTEPNSDRGGKTSHAETVSQDLHPVNRKGTSATGLLFNAKKSAGSKSSRGEAFMMQDSFRHTTRPPASSDLLGGLFDSVLLQKTYYSLQQEKVKSVERVTTN